MSFMWYVAPRRAHISGQLWLLSPHQVIIFKDMLFILVRIIQTDKLYLIPKLWSYE